MKNSCLFKNRQMLFGLLLAGIADISIIGLVATSGWFIVVSALAGLSIFSTFSYIVPSALVRTFAVARIAFNYFQRLVLHRQSMQNLTDIRLAFFDRAANLRQKQFLPAGQLIDRLVKDTDDDSKALIRVIEPAVVYGLSGLAVSLTFTFVRPILGLLSLLMIINVLGLTYWFYKRMTGAQSQTDQLRGALREQSIFAQDSWLDLQSLGADRVIQMRLQERLGQFNLKKQHHQQKDNLLTLAFNVVTAIWILVIFAFILFGTAESIAIIILLFLMLIGINTTASTLPKAAKEAVLVNQVRVRMEMQDLIDSKQNSQAGTVNWKDSVLSIQEYNVPAIAIMPAQKISFDVSHPELVLLHGPSGCGKTTLLNWVVGQLTLEDYRYVMVDDYIFNATVRENLLLDHAESDGKIIEMLNSIGLDDLNLDDQIGFGGRELSGGEQVRLTDVRGLLATQPIIIFDEPLAGLDEQTKQAVLQQLLILAKEHIVITVIHDAELTNNLRGQSQIVEFAAEI